MVGLAGVGGADKSRGVHGALGGATASEENSHYLLGQAAMGGGEVDRG